MTVRHARFAPLATRGCQFQFATRSFLNEQLINLNLTRIFRLNEYLSGSRNSYAYRICLFASPYAIVLVLSSFFAKFRFRFQPCPEALSTVMNERITRNRIRDARQFRSECVNSNGTSSQQFNH